MTSNLPFDEWTEIFGSERLTGALLDRLTHHIHILEMNGDSYRLNQSKKQRKPPKSTLLALTTWTTVAPVQGIISITSDAFLLRPADAILFRR